MLCMTELSSKVTALCGHYVVLCRIVLFAVVLFGGLFSTNDAFFLAPGVADGSWKSQPSHPSIVRRQKLPSKPTTPDARSQSRTTTATTLWAANLWDKLGIEEDEEPLWYVLNCVAGLELNLLQQCRQECASMDGVVKFVVPTEKQAVRSHGKNRMVSEMRVKYQGYVFAKLRLCKETYQTIQGLDLCRSWMGTVNQKGNRKLPPRPVCLNEMEIEDYGLEDMEYEDDAEGSDYVEQKQGEETGVLIVDTAERDAKEAMVDEETRKVYQGLRVEDMIKVTAKGKFYNEDGIVRRLKDGKVYIRFYTYGTMYDEWLDPDDVRKLSNEEILRGLSGPSQPITQQQIDGPRGGRERDGYSYRDGRLTRDSDNGRTFMGGGGSRGLGGQRNRRQDRVANRFRSSREYDEESRNRDNWNWYKENQRRKQGGAYSDDDIDIRGASRYNEGNNNESWRDSSIGRDRNWAQRDVESQWGRGRGGREGRMQPQPRNNSNRQRGDRSQRRRNNVGDDWTQFVSKPASSSNEREKEKESEDFFSSLMSDLYQDLDSNNNDGNKRGSANRLSEEDEFFESLLSDISEQNGDAPSGEDDFIGSFQRKESNVDAAGGPPSSSSSLNNKIDDNDFFANLESDLGASLGASGGAGSVDNFADDDFFASLQTDVTKASKPPKKKNRESSIDPSNDDDFFASLEAELGDAFFNGQDDEAAKENDDDFFGSLDLDISKDLENPKKAGNEADAIQISDPVVETAPAAAKTPPTAEPQPQSKKQRTASTNPNKSSGSSPLDSSSLEKLTVPVLKDMLRERGMKVSGTKAILIERLVSQ